MPSGPTAVLAATLNIPWNAGEGIEYDQTNNRLVIGSLSSGRIVGIPLPDASTPQTYSMYNASLATVHTYFTGSDDVFATAGLQVDQDDECLLYAAVGGYPSRTSVSGVQMGIATINLCEDRLEFFTNLTRFARGSMANDMTRVGDTIYVTDFLGSQVLKVIGQNTPTPVVEKLMDFSGANGIEHADDNTLLISSAFGGYLAKYDIATRAVSQVRMTAGPNVVGDGIVFDSSRTTLLVTNGGGSYGGQVSVLKSSDNWATATLAENVPSGCDSMGPQTATVIARGKIYTYCAAGFGMGPYTVRSAELPGQPDAPAQSWKWRWTDTFPFGFGWVWKGPSMWQWGWGTGGPGFSWIWAR